MSDFYSGDALTSLSRAAPVEPPPPTERWPPIVEPPATISSEHAREVFMCLYRHGPDGLADFQLEQRLSHITPSSVRSRRAELEYDGFVEQLRGAGLQTMRMTPSGRVARVWRISQRMIDYYRGFSNQEPRWSSGTSGGGNRSW